MEAHTVWKLWRRILREPELRAQMFGATPDGAAGLADAGLSGQERAIIDAYAANEPSIRFFVEGYSYRLLSSALNALETAGPLTRRVLDARNVDVRTLLRDLLEADGWRDFGPYVYTFGERILDYLDTRPDVLAIAGSHDLIRVERAATSTVLAAADWPAGRRWPMAAPRLLVNPWLRLVTCDLDISDWLRGPAHLGRTAPRNGPRQFAVYLPALDARPRIIALPRTAAAALAQLIDASEGDHDRHIEFDSHDCEPTLTKFRRMGILAQAD